MIMKDGKHKFKTTTHVKYEILILMCLTMKYVLKETHR